jgi:hypothetical protein
MANLFKEKPIVKVVMLKGQDGEEKLINQADGSGLSFWIGTKAEYDAIPEAELIENCVYYITDDTRDDFNTRLNELDTQVNEYLTYLTKQNQVLWEGAVNDSSTAEEKVLTANGIETYKLVALVVGRSSSTDTEDITILAYKNRNLLFAGYNCEWLENPRIEAAAQINLVISSGSIVADKCQFAFADFKIGSSAVEDAYLKKIIGVM